MALMYTDSYGGCRVTRVAQSDDVSAEAALLEALAEGVGEPLDGQSAAEFAYAAIRAGITRDLLPPGTRLAEAELATTLGVSRTPVRSALQTLLRDGLLSVGSKRQLYVREFSPAERREVVMLRTALEQVAITAASKTIELSEIDELRLTLMRQRRAADAGDVETFLDLDDQFHLGIAERAQLPLLMSFLDQLRACIRLMGLRAASRPGRMPDVLAEHGAIVDALEVHDTKAALAALDRHLSNTYEYFEGVEGP
jgi:GntR family transcriptional regulator, rspAB operon transcriptional repressor